MPTLIARERETIEHRAQLAGNLSAQLSSLTVEATETVSEEVIQVIRSPRGVAERFDRLQLEAERVIEGFIKAPLFNRPGNPAQDIARRRGVRFRGLYERAVLHALFSSPNKTVTHGFFEVSAIILTLAAMASYLNYRFLRLPSTIGLMFIPLLASLLLILVSKMGLRVDDYVRPVLATINFSEVLFNGMLSFLLFAGALHIDLRVLQKERWSVAGWPR